MPELPKDLPRELRSAARDVAYIAIGLGVLGYQRLQHERAKRQRGHGWIDELLETPVRVAGSTVKRAAGQVPPEATQVMGRVLGQALRRGNDFRRLLRS